MTIPDDDAREIAAAVGCTFDGCDSHDVWVAIEGRDGTDVEGCVAFLCETHTKQMIESMTKEERRAWISNIKSVRVTELRMGLN